MPTPLANEEKQLNLKSISCGKLNWIYIEMPDTQEVDYLAAHYNFNQLNLDDVLSRVQRPKIDQYPDHLFIVLHFPVYNKANRVTTPSEVDIFIGENYIVTIHKSGDLKPLAKFFNECLLDERTCSAYMSRSSGFLLYHILDRLVNYCFPILNKVVDNVEKMENLIFSKAVPETVHEIMLIRRDIIAFRRIIHPQIAVVEALERIQFPVLKEHQDVYFGDIADHIRKIWDGLEDSKEMVDGLVDTSNWLTSHNIQEVMRIWTIIMALLTVPGLIASIWSMNVRLPGTGINSYWPWILIVLLMIISTALTYLFFRRRRWL
jgi:magnesium transporter